MRRKVRTAPPPLCLLIYHDAKIVRVDVRPGHIDERRLNQRFDHAEDARAYAEGLAAMRGWSIEDQTIQRQGGVVKF